MKIYEAGQCDIAVIGAGHAGIEAALAAARIGLLGVLFCHKSGQCGQHALQPGHRRHGQGAPGARAGRHGRGDGPRGGLILHTIPARSNWARARRCTPLRAQADRRRYQAVMKLALESQDGLRLIQGEIVDVERPAGRAVEAVVTRTARAGAAARPSALHGHLPARPHLHRRGGGGLRAGRAGGQHPPRPGGWRRWGFRCGASKRARRRA